MLVLQTKLSGGVELETNQYLSMFIDESNDHLQALNENLLILENNPKDISIVQNIFRSAHTLKGMSATMGFEDIASLTHEMENVLDLVRNLKLDMDPFIFDTLFRGLDSLESMVQDIIQGGVGKADVTAIVVNLKDIVTGNYNKAGNNQAPVTQSNQNASTILLDEFQFSVLQQSIEQGNKVYYIDVKLNEDCVLKAVRAYMVFDALEQNGEVVKSSPTVQELEQEKFDRSFSIYYISTFNEEGITKLVESVSEVESASVMLVDLESLKQMVLSAEESAATQLVEVSNKAEDKQSLNRASGAAANAPLSNRTIRVDIERLDTLMNLFSELLIDRVRLEQLASEVKKNELTETVEHMSRVSSDLQSIVLKLRMVPVDSVFNRFPRMVRDLAKSLDKKVDLIIEGADTELDRTVIDEIGDPLVHLIRNAVDHGIESIGDRKAVGKDETGSVYLRAFHSGNSVFIEIEEDGKGINKDAILQSAIKKGVVTPEQAKKMSNEEVFQLLFAAGFSTAEKISDISGRGVGLDVVKSKITSLGGNVSVDSKLGIGTKFSVQLPLTLSIISAMLIKLGQEKYAIPLSSIVETAVIQKKQIRSVHGNRMLDYRNHVIPIISLSQLFNSPDYDESGEEETEIIVIRKADKMAALMVDEFIGQQEIVLKGLGKYLTNLYAISGATILGDGQVALIIDPNALIK